MNLRIGICDDEPADIAHLAEQIRHYALLSNTQFDMEPFSSGASLLHAHQTNPFHILFLDIEMPGVDGMALARYLRNEIYDDVFLIFVTSYPEYMCESFEVQPFQFLIKPVSYPSIEKLLSAIMQRYEHSRLTTKVILDNFGVKHVFRLNDILYIDVIKGEKGFLEYHLISGNLTGAGTIREWEDDLMRYGFCSPCRGYLVNTKYIKRLDSSELLLTDGTKLPISRRKNEQIRQIYANRIIHVLK